MVDTKTTATDLIGTVRHETHGDGYSVWVKVQASRRSEFFPYWLCVHSTAEGNIGEHLPCDVVEQDKNTVVGAIPGTPAGRR
jgi:hypothetical protein